MCHPAINSLKINLRVVKLRTNGLQEFYPVYEFCFHSHENYFSTLQHIWFRQHTSFWIEYWISFETKSPSMIISLLNCFFLLSLDLEMTLSYYWKRNLSFLSTNFLLSASDCDRPNDLTIKEREYASMTLKSLASHFNLERAKKYGSCHQPLPSKFKIKQSNPNNTNSSMVCRYERIFILLSMFLYLW